MLDEDLLEGQIHGESLGLVNDDGGLIGPL